MQWYSLEIHVACSCLYFLFVVACRFNQVCTVQEPLLLCVGASVPNAAQSIKTPRSELASAVTWCEKFSSIAHFQNWEKQLSQLASAVTWCEKFFSIAHFQNWEKQLSELPSEFCGGFCAQIYFSHETNLSICGRVNCVFLQQISPLKCVNFANLAQYKLDFERSYNLSSISQIVANWLQIIIGDSNFPKTNGI